MTTDSFLLIVTKAKLVGTIKGSKILKITKVDAATLNVNLKTTPKNIIFILATSKMQTIN